MTGSQAPTRPSRISGWFVADVLCYALVAAFLAAALLRRLNWDEASVLRAGWLLWERIVARPPLCMPLSLALGGLSHAVLDPGWLFGIARGTTAAAVLAFLALAFRAATDDGRTARLAFLLTLSQAAFGAHGLEFRYDAALLVGSLSVFACLVDSTPARQLLAGVAILFVAAHQTKGLVVAAGLYAFFWSRHRGDAVALRRGHVGLAASSSLWLLILLARGQIRDLVATYGFWASLGAGVTRYYPWETLGPTFRRDLWWWLAALAAAVAGVSALSRVPASERRSSPELWALAFAALGLALVFVHPHPWAYMLALPAPFLALVMARVFSRLHVPGRAAALSLLAGALLLDALSGNPPLFVYSRSFEAPRAPEVETLKLLRRIARPTERIVDPTGLAYFLPPCSPDWYLDALFQERARRGLWMRDVVPDRPEECPWILDTYRLDFFRPKVRRQLLPAYQMLPGGLGLVRSDSRLQTKSTWATLPAVRPENFW